MKRINWIILFSVALSMSACDNQTEEVRKTTPLVNVLTDGALHIKAGEVGMFEFKIEKAFLQSDDLEERLYRGSLILEATNLQNREQKTLTVVFDFNLIKDNVRISRMHARLFFGMLIRFPVLILKKKKKGSKD